MRLYLCEKPSQGAEIARFVGAGQRRDGYFEGPDVVVTFCVGHLLEQAGPEAYTPALANGWRLEPLPVIPQAWTIVPVDDKRSQVNTIKRLLKNADEVVIATDAGREGELIAREALDFCGYRGRLLRLWTSSQDPDSLRQALRQLRPGSAYDGLHAAALARQRADWLVGMNVTMAMTLLSGVGRGRDALLSVGRVQTPTLALVVRRDREIEAFVPRDHFRLDGVFRLAKGELVARWQPPATLLSPEGLLLDRRPVDAVAAKVRGQTGLVTLADSEAKQEGPPLPYSLSTLQRECNRRLKLTAKQTLDIAQELYEKFKATSYPRTDFEHLPTNLHGEAAGILAGLTRINPAMASLVAGADPALRSRAWNDSKVGDHYGIIPTRKGDVDRSAMSERVRQVYDLICRRYLAQFYPPYQYLATTIEVECMGERFRATGQTPVKPGWKVVYAGLEERPAPADTDDNATLPPATLGEPAPCTEARVVALKTKPPARFTEATLLEAMSGIAKYLDDPELKRILKETQGLGTSATWAAIIERLLQVGYLERVKNTLLSTPKGRALIDVLPQELTDPALTARWEQALEQIAEGKVAGSAFEQMIGQFCSKVVERLKASPPPKIAVAQPETAPAATKSRAAPARQAEGPHYPCPQCQKPLRLRQGTKGAFWGCTGYPDCRASLPDNGGKPGARPPADLNQTRRPTPPAAAPALTRTGRIGDPCPSCGQGKLTGRATRDGRAFVGCTRYADGCRHFQRG